MINQESLSLMQSLMISGAGMLVVVMELAVLAVAIKVFTGFSSLLGDKEAVPVPANAVSENDDELAVVLAVMDAELNAEGETYRITSVRERPLR